VNCKNNGKNNQPVDLNTEETEEYQHWIRLMKEICNIQKALRKNPNREGLEQARTRAYNVLADIQIIIDMIDKKQ
jgi:hypothetical protein